MNTDKMTVTETRDVAPQWSGGKGGNLGEFTLSFIGVSPDGVAELSKDPAMRGPMADILNNQLGIRFNSPLCKAKVLEALKAKGISQGEDEKWAEFAERTLPNAREVAKDVLKDFVMDAINAFKTWALEDFPKRGQRTDKRPVLADYDKIVARVEAQWDAMTNERKLKVITGLGLGKELASGVATDVVKTISAKYQRPVAVKTESLFGDE